MKPSCYNYTKDNENKLTIMKVPYEPFNLQQYSYIIFV